jgi:hypothetical protein
MICASPPREPARAWTSPYATRVVVSQVRIDSSERVVAVVPGDRTDTVDSLLVQLDQHRDALGWVECSTSLPPLAQVLSALFNNADGSSGDGGSDG